MRTSFPAISLLAAFAATAGFAQPPIAQPATLAMPGTKDLFPARVIALPNGVRGYGDLVYSSVPGYRPMTLDLYRPSATMRPPAAGFPLVVYIHGGGWSAGTARNGGALANFPEALASLAARGYVVASVNYRLSGEVRFPAPEQDVKAALGWLRGHASDYGIDPAKAVIWGGSAGGHLASLAAVTCGETGTPVAADCVQGAVIWYGVFDFATLGAQSSANGVGGHDDPAAAEWKLLGCKAEQCRNGEIAAASPVDHVDPRDPPMLLIAGKADRTVPYKQSVEMADRLKAAGVPATLMLLDDIDHSFIGKTPAATRDATLRAWNATVRFIDRTIGATGR